MLKIRVIPTLLWKDLGLVKGIGFNSWRSIGAILPAIKVYNTRDVDELIIMDILASRDNTQIDYDELREFSAACSVPLTIGGGINNVEQIHQLLLTGADKILINTAAFTDISLIEKSAMRFGSQCIVAGIDVKQISGKYLCFSHAGTRMIDINPIEWAKELADKGSGEIIITSIDRDGTMTGYDLPLIESIANAVNIPVIASGGAGNYEHMCDAVLKAGASAVAGASMFHFTEQTPLGAKKALAEKNIPVRNSLALHGDFIICQ